MKTQILSRWNMPVNIIGFLLLVPTALIGCGVLFNVNGIMTLNPIILTEDDLPMLRVTSIHHLNMPLKEPSVIEVSVQQWRYFQVQYWLLDSSSTAKKAAAEGWIWWKFAAMPNFQFQPELNPEKVIGDATWFNISSLPNAPPDLLFVKNNVLIHVLTREAPSANLQFARDVARKIEAKIESVLEKK